MDYLSLPVSSICIVVIFFVQFYAFGTSFRRRDNSRVTSFFALPLVMDKRLYRSLSFLSALPLSFLFTFFVFQSDGLSRTIVESVAELVNMQNVNELLKRLPSFLYIPITLLFLVYLLRGTFRYLRQFIERIIVYLSGISDYAETQVQAVSECLLESLSYQDAVKIIIEKNYEDVRSLSLPEELYTADTRRKLAYHLLQLSTKRISESGFSSTLLNEIKRNFFDNVNQETQEKICNQLDVGRIPNLLTRFFLGLTIYIVVAGIWAAIIPMLAETMKSEFNILWPIYTTREGSWWPFVNHIKSILAATSVSIVPAVVGIRILQMRARQIGRQDAGATLGIVAAIFVASMLLNLLYLESVLGLDVVSKYVTEKQPDEDGILIEISYWIYWASYSLVASLVVMVVMSVGSGATRGVLAGTFVMGAGYFVAHWSFEAVLALEAGFDRYRFHWHQGGLGSALGLTGLAISEYVFRIKTTWSAKTEAYRNEVVSEDRVGR